MLKIRKITLLIVVLGLALVKTNAQSYYKEDERTFYGGLSLGAVFSQLDGDNFAGYHNIGLTGGGIVYARVAPRIAPSLELLYTQKGAVSNTEKNAINVRVNSYKVKLNYMEVPVMLNYFDKRKSHFGIGLSYSQLISQTETTTTTPALPATYNPDDYPFRKYDINAVAGVNLHLLKGFFLNIRYQYSLLSVRDTWYPDLGRIGAKGQYNNLWSFRVMYLF